MGSTVNRGRGLAIGMSGGVGGHYGRAISSSPGAFELARAIFLDF